MMFQNFPKKRHGLPSEFKKVYLKWCILNRTGGTPANCLGKKMESWLHKQVADDLLKSKEKLSNISTLEIGAGTLNQLNYEPVVGPYDIIEPCNDFVYNSENKKKLRNHFKDISNISHSHYDRITSCATFEHLSDLPYVVAKTGLLLNTNGSLRISIPNEGSFLWMLCWKISTGIDFYIRYHMNYAILMRYEHINTANEIFSVLNYFYNSVKIKFFGFSKNWSIYHFYECNNPDIAKCKKYIDEYCSK